MGHQTLLSRYNRVMAPTLRGDRQAPDPMTVPDTKPVHEEATPTDADTLIVGGGPAGAAAGITLARNGHRVVIIDKASFPRDKCCGDGLTTGALRLLDGLGLDPVDVPSWKPIRTVQVAGPRGDAIQFDLPTGPGHFAAIARRSELDHALLLRARTAGVEVREGVTITGITTTEDSVLARHQRRGLPAHAI